jgi:integrase
MTWNKDRIIGRKPPLTPEQVQVIKALLSQAGELRDIALFSLAIDSSLRGCDLVALRVLDVSDGQTIKDRAAIAQKKTRGRVSFSMTPYTQVALQDLIQSENKGLGDYLFTGQRKGKGKAITTAHYRRLVKEWLTLAHMNPERFGSHSLRRTKIALVYKKTGNLKVAQLLLGHKSLQHTQHYLGIEEEQALDIADSFGHLL